MFPPGGFFSNKLEISVNFGGKNFYPPFIKKNRMIGGVSFKVYLLTDNLAKREKGFKELPPREPQKNPGRFGPAKGGQGAFPKGPNSPWGPPPGGIKTWREKGEGRGGAVVFPPPNVENVDPPPSLRRVGGTGGSKNSPR